MKPQRLIFLLTIFLLNALFLQAQDNSFPFTQLEVLKQVYAEAVKMTPANEQPCAAQAKERINGLKKFIETNKAYSDGIQDYFVELGDLIEKINQTAKKAGKPSPINRGLMNSDTEKVISAYDNSSDFKSFITLLTNQKFELLEEKETFTTIYTRLENFESYPHEPINVYLVDPKKDKCKQVHSASFSDANLAWPTMVWYGYFSYSAMNCTCKDNPADLKSLWYKVKFSVKVKLERKTIEVVNDGKKVKKTRFVPVYQAPKNIKIDKYTVECCPAKVEKEDPKVADGEPADPNKDTEAMIDGVIDGLVKETESDQAPQPKDTPKPNKDTEAMIDGVIDGLIDETDSDKQPQPKDTPKPDPKKEGEIGQYFQDPIYPDSSISDSADPFGRFISTGLGFGFDGEDDELQLCAAIGYFTQIYDGERSDLFVGGEAKLNYTALLGENNDFNRTDVQIGPAVEWRRPIKSDHVALTAGLGGGFGFGSQGNSDFRDNFTTGFFSGSAGLYIQLQNLAFGISAPVFQYQRTNIRRDGDNFTNSNFGFGLNKGNPVQIRALIPIGQDK
ncbi:MAG: outer membrane beta-barrel protein [Bacteroidota bacterium]